MAIVSITDIRQSAIYPTKKSSCMDIDSSVAILHDIFTLVSERTVVNDKATIIANRRRELEKLKDKWRDFIAQNYPTLDLNHLQIQKSYIGIGATYFVTDGNTNIYVIKPIDEELGCFNNDYYHFIDNGREGRFYDNIPLYTSVFHDLLAYELARELGFEHLVPKTFLSITSSKSFYDIEEDLFDQEKEKLCSVQEFIQGTQMLSDILYYGSETDQVIIDEDDYEKFNVLVWLMNDCDAHFSNILTYKKGRDSEGNIIWGIIKIDSSLSFPESNQYLRNPIVYSPQGENCLSEKMQSFIQNMDLQHFIEKMQFFGLHDRVKAFQERIEALKQYCHLPIIEINEHMRCLGEIEEDL